jgi:hypothetical protein
MAEDSGLLQEQVRLCAGFEFAMETQTIAGMGLREPNHHARLHHQSRASHTSIHKRNQEITTRCDY